MRRQLRWSARRRADGGQLRIPGNGGIMLPDLVDFEGFRDGWYLPDPNGIWTQGRRAELAVTFDGGAERPVLDVGIDAVRVGASGAVTVEVIVDDERVAVREFTTEDRSALQSVRIPLLPRLVYIAKAVLPTAVRNRLYPLFWRLFTPASLGSSVVYLKSTVRSWRIELPSRVVTRRNAQLTFVIDKPRVAEDVDPLDDTQSLGFHLRSLRMDSL
jgi:hypothetical protein